MFCLKDGEIVPGERIGGIRLGMGSRELKDLIQEYEVHDLPDYEVMICENAKIWIHKERDVSTQILVQGDFGGKYQNRIGIGSTLADVQTLLDETWHEELDTYVLDHAPGMCFELGDSGDETYWDERTAPIEAISVYSAAPLE